MIEVTALRAHRSGYAPGYTVAVGESYFVPEGAVAALVRQGLVAEPAEAESEPDLPALAEAGGVGGGDEGQG